MKNKIIIITISLISAISFAQNGINYKALIKDANGNVLASSPVNIKFIIYEGAALTNNTYQESHTINTDANGFVIVNIGEGTTSDDFSTINWSNDEHFLNVQVNIGSGLVDLGTTAFKTVPYAKVAENVKGLEAIDEGNGVGWRLTGRNPDNHGNVGEKALDFSESQFPSETLGATGELSVAFGRNSSAIGYSSFAMGDVATAGGEQSFSFGEQSRSPGDFSIAMGFNGLATGDYSASIGRSNLVFGNASFAAGSSNQISSDAENAFAMGRSNLISSDFAIAMGDNNTVSGNGGIALGRDNESESSYAATIGLNNTASGTYSFAAGSSNTTSNLASFAAGSNNTSSGQYSFAVGSSNSANGSGSVALGFGNEALENFSIALGRNNEASGNNSVAIGEGSIASGNNSVAIGENLEARAAHETVLGYGNTLYNPANVSDPRIFTIGNGVLQVMNNTVVLTRRNAMVILRNGNVGLGTSTPEERLHIANGRLRIGTETIEDTGSNRLSFNASLLPDADDAMNLGNANFRWNAVWSVDGTINTSDRREKKNIKNLNYGLAEILQMQPVSFNWKNKNNPDLKLGLIAQDLLKLTPEVVKTHVWETDEITGQLTKKELDRLGVYYADLVPVLINAIQEQQKIITTQKGENLKQTSELNSINETLKMLLSRMEALESQSSN